MAVVACGLSQPSALHNNYRECDYGRKFVQETNGRHGTDREMYVQANQTISRKNDCVFYCLSTGWLVGGLVGGLSLVCTYIYFVCESERGKRKGKGNNEMKVTVLL